MRFHRRRSRTTHVFRFAAAFVVFGLCRTVSASPLWIYPATGPTSGGTEVILKGGPFSFCPHPECRPYPPEVFFGRAPATSVELVDESTLKVIAPPHFPGTADVYVDQWWRPINTSVPFTFTGEFPNEGVERILVPLLTYAHGAYGSSFSSALRLGAASNPARVSVYGVEAWCPFECIPLRDDEPLILSDPYSAYAVQEGTPGRFIYVPRSDLASVAMHLAVYGSPGGATELPLVRDRDFTTRRITLLGVPADSRLRNTLRIYSAAATAVRITIAGREPVDVPLTRPKSDVFTPYYAMFSDFPVGTSAANVVIEPIPPVGSSAEAAPIWAFVSVTNNQTQMITTITPQP